MRKKKIITICSSVSFYEKVIDVSKELRKYGFRVITPKGVLLRSRDVRYKSDSFKKQHEATHGYKVKASLIRDHFKRIHQADYILIVNEEKKSQKGYIGANVLMEMGIAFDLKKPIFVLNKPTPLLQNYDEIMGVLPIFLEGNLEKLSNKRKP